MAATWQRERRENGFQIRGTGSRQLAGDQLVPSSAASLARLAPRSRRARAGGYALDKIYQLPPVNFTTREAALLIALARLATQRQLIRSPAAIGRRRRAESRPHERRPCRADRKRPRKGAVGELREAVRSLCRDTPDLVVTGVELADASGLDLIEAARQLSPTSRIVVVGPSPTTEVWRRQVTAGAIRFVAAGPSFDELCEVVAALARPAPERGPTGAGGTVATRTTRSGCSAGSLRGARTTSAIPWARSPRWSR